MYNTISSECNLSLGFDMVAAKGSQRVVRQATLTEPFNGTCPSNTALKRELFNFENKFTFLFYPRCDFKVVQCSTVEAALMKHEDVFDCAAFAEISPDHGEVPSAWVILQPGITYNEALF